MRNLLDNPAISIHRQAFEPTVAEMAETKRRHNKHLADSIEEARDDVDTVHCILMTLKDDLQNDHEYCAIIYNLKSAMQLMENLANKLEVV